MDRAWCRAAQSSRYALAGQPGGDRPGQEAEGCSSHFVHDSRLAHCELSRHEGSKENGEDQVCSLWVWRFRFPVGTFADCSSEAEVQQWMRYNVFLLLSVGTFSALVELLNMEIEYVFMEFLFFLLNALYLFFWIAFVVVISSPHNGKKRLDGWSAYYLLYVSLSNSAACSSAVRKPAISLADSTDLRVLLNIMYLMVETIQQDDPTDKPEWKIIRETFRAELGRFAPAPVS